MWLTWRQPEDLEFPGDVWVEHPGSDGASLCGTLSRAIWAPSSFDFPALLSLLVAIYTRVDHIYVPGRKKKGGPKVRRGMPAEIAL